MAKLCNEQKEAKRKLGAQCTRALMLRLAQLQASDTLGEMFFGNPHPLKGSRLGQYSITIKDGLRLVFEAADPIPKTQDNATDWRNVEAITIINIEDYH